jgi:tyrosyl-tRNA synthetase
MLPAYDFWQFWRNTSDADTGKFLKLFTELPMDEIARLETLEGAELNEAKKILADEVTKLARGADAAASAAQTAQETFEQGGLGADLPRVSFSAADLADGVSAAQLFVRSGLAASGKEAKRLIQDGGAKVNDEAVNDVGRMFSASDFADGPLKLSAGKKRHALAEII